MSPSRDRLVVAASPPAPKPPRAKKVAKPRADLKHFGGYLDDDTLEKIALLRVRLKKDNSDLIKLAIDELHAKHKAKRAKRSDAACAAADRRAQGQVSLSCAPLPDVNLPRSVALLCQGSSGKDMKCERS